jgi:alkylation response protein AidB-like acyl-CoA dehydrogenase
MDPRPRRQQGFIHDHRWTQAKRGVDGSTIRGVSVTTDGVYDIPQDLADLRDMIRRLAQERIAPRAAEIDRDAQYPHDIRALLAEHDVLGLPFDEEHGGTGTGTLMLNIAVEEIAKACASSALILMVQELGTLPIALFGTEEQRQRWLPRCATGEWSPAFALSEPEAGSDPASMRTTAVRDGDEWVVNGQKNWITNAGIADFYIVFAKTDRDNNRSSAFVVEADREGFDPGKLEHKLGIKGSPTGSPSFTDVRIPAANLIGVEGKGLSVALAPRRGRAGRRHRAGRDGLRRAVRARADRVRQAHQHDAGHPVQARRHGDAHGRRPRAALQGVREGRPQRGGSREVLLDGEALRVGQRDVRDARGDPDPRRLRLRQRVPGRADDARREDHADLRGYERDPAGRHRPLDEVGAPCARRPCAAS